MHGYLPPTVADGIFKSGFVRWRRHNAPSPPFAPISRQLRPDLKNPKSDNATAWYYSSVQEVRARRVTIAAITRGTGERLRRCELYALLREGR